MICFTKMEGIGNDFIIIDDTENIVKYDYSKLSEYLCNRHFGIGADGVMFAQQSDKADYKMRIFNKDGSEAEMCGNGIRCFAKYLYETNKIHKESVNIETLAGIKNAKLIFEGKKISNILINMGKPEFEYSKIPVYYENDYCKNIIEIEGLEVYPISVGNPHTVCFVDNIDNINIGEIGKKIENYKYFPNKTNVEFVEIVDKNNIKIRVWERGVGETLACGTGACAAAVISHKYKGLENNINVQLKGGNLNIKYNQIENEVWLKGEANMIYEGKIYI